MRSISKRFHNLKVKLKIKAMTFSPEYRRNLSCLKNIHEGERCFIIGNGPSLTAEDLDKIKAEYSFASNKIYKIFPKTQWRPTYYCASDNGIIDESIDEINSLSVNKKFLSLNYLVYNKKPKSYFKDAIIFRETYPHKMNFDNPIFSDDITKGIACGNTVTYIMIQIAVYMGFKEIYLLGVDHGLPKGYTQNTQNHFYADEKHDKTICDFNISTASYQKSEDYAKLHNIKICNATRGGNLEVFERIDLNKVVS